MPMPIELPEGFTVIADPRDPKRRVILRVPADDPTHPEIIRAPGGRGFPSRYRAVSWFYMSYARRHPDVLADGRPA